VYTSACFFILDKQDVENHHTASVIMAAVLVYCKGSYSSGLLHARRMLQIVPNDYTNYEWVLLFYAIPENLITRQEAYVYAQKILSMNQNHKLALKTKNEIENAWLHNIPEPEQHVPHDADYSEFVKLVHTGFYKEAKSLVSHYSFDEFEKIVYMLTDWHQSVAFYTYAFFMLLDKETVQGHLLAGKLLLRLKNVFGSESGALFHARRARELAPNSLIVLDFFLSFYNLVNPLISDVEAIYCARDILTIDPEHTSAKAIITKFQKN
jgi:hypothetical protein